MAITLRNRATGEELSVELELGEDLWVRDQQGEQVQAKRAHFPLDRWCFVGTHPSIDDVPVPITGAPGAGAHQSRQEATR